MVLGDLSRANVNDVRPAEDICKKPKDSFRLLLYRAERGRWMIRYHRWSVLRLECLIFLRTPDSEGNRCISPMIYLWHIIDIKYGISTESFTIQQNRSQKKRNLDVPKITNIRSTLARMNNISIVPCRMEDVEEMEPVGTAAFATDPVNQAIFDVTTANEDDLADYRAWRVQLNRERMKGDGKYYFKAVDDATGKMIGYIGIFDPSVDIAAQAQFPRPACINVEAEKSLKDQLHEAEERWMNSQERMWCKLALIELPGSIILILCQTFNRCWFIPTIKVVESGNAFFNAVFRSPTKLEGPSFLKVPWWEQDFTKVAVFRWSKHSMSNFQTARSTRWVS
jgi:hypothetical protein